MRAIAILLVIACHYEGFVALLGPIKQYGWVGVDLFFVLSGYLITSVLLNLRGKPFPYRTFYGRRIVRIFPPYLAVSILILLVVLPTHHHEAFGASYIAQQALFLQAFSLEQYRFVTGLIHEPMQTIASAPPLLAHAHQLPRGSMGLTPTTLSPSVTYWSLSVEEYFYLFWAPVVLKLDRPAVIGVAIGIAVLEPALRWAYPGADSVSGILFRFDAPIYGAILALLMPQMRPPSAHWSLTATLVASLMCLLALLGAIAPVIGYEIRESPLFRVFGLPLIAIAAACVIGLTTLRANSRWWFARFCRTKVMRYLGSISYTMYLLHVLMLLLVMAAFGTLLRLRERPSAAVVFAEAVVSLVLTVLAAGVSWRFMEGPLQRWKNRRLASEALLGTDQELHRIDGHPSGPVERKRQVHVNHTAEG